MGSCVPSVAFPTASVPVASSYTTTSVKVPPTSTPTQCMTALLKGSESRRAGGRGDPAARRVSAAYRRPFFHSSYGIHFPFEMTVTRNGRMSSPRSLNFVSPVTPTKPETDASASRTFILSRVPAFS